jgi:hypothetical protein
MLNALGGFGVEMGSGLVAQQHLRIQKERAHEAYELALAT